MTSSSAWVSLSLVQIEFDLTVVAAMLAVVGYSLNDTIVVFDRIRENFPRYRKRQPVEVVNTSINETLSRTLMTSGTTLLVLFALFFFGGEIIHGFAFTLIVGIIVGTYSSIYVASAALLMLRVSKYDLMAVEKEGARRSTPGPDSPSISRFQMKFVKNPGLCRDFTLASAATYC